MDEIYISDGYTQTRTIPSVSGLHPELVIVFRPALDKEKQTFRIKNQSPDPAVIDNYTTETITKYIVSINGAELPKDKEKVGRIKPIVRGYLLDLILGYTAADEAKDAKN